MATQLNEMSEGYTNLTKSVLGIAKDEIEQKAIARLDTCKTCDKYDIASRCTLCGCFMPAKVRVSEAQCPADKW